MCNVMGLLQFELMGLELSSLHVSMMPAWTIIIQSLPSQIFAATNMSLITDKLFEQIVIAWVCLCIEMLTC